MRVDLSVGTAVVEVSIHVELGLVGAGAADGGVGLDRGSRGGGPVDLGEEHEVDIGCHLEGDVEIRVTRAGRGGDIVHQAVRVLFGSSVGDGRIDEAVGGVCGTARNETRARRPCSVTIQVGLVEEETGGRARVGSLHDPGDGRGKGGEGARAVGEGAIHHGEECLAGDAVVDSLRKSIVLKIGGCSGDCCVSNRTGNNCR